VTPVITYPMPYSDHSTVQEFLPSIDADRLLAAISQVESGNDDRAVGRLGEVSRFQLLPCNWRKMSDRPLSDATNLKVSHEIALAWLRTLALDLRLDKLPVTAENLCWSWKCGLRGVLLRKWMAQASRSYVTRCLTLYQEN
jgi:hypothetical protein